MTVIILVAFKNTQLAILHVVIDEQQIHAFRDVFFFDTKILWVFLFITGTLRDYLDVEDSFLLRTTHCELEQYLAPIKNVYNIESANALLDYYYNPKSDFYLPKSREAIFIRNA